MFAPAPHAAAADSYDGLVARLNGLVSQRASLLSRLSAADGAVGARALSDVLAALRSPLEAQAGQARRFAAALVASDPGPPIARDPSFYRAAGAGLLLGPNLPISEGINASGQSATPARPPLTSASRSDLANPPSETAPQLPPLFQSLGTAWGPVLAHGIDLHGGSTTLTALAPQAVAPLAPAAPVVAPRWYAPTVWTGASAARAYADSANALMPALASMAAPSSVSSTGVSRTARPTSVSALQTLFGHYQTTGVSGKPAPGYLGHSGAIAWTMNAVEPTAGGATLQVQAQGTLTAGTARGTTYSVFSVDTASPVVSPSPLVVHMDLLADGSGVLTASTTLSNSTTLRFTAHVPNVLADPQIARALAAEQVPLQQLGDTLHQGDAVYQALVPLYQQRATVYQQALAVAMRQNAVLEQGWWDQTQRWVHYQTALTLWKQKRSLWRKHEATTHGGAGGDFRGLTTSPTAVSDFALQGTATPSPSSHLVTGPGSYEGGNGGALGVGGGPAERLVAPLVVTPIFAATDTAVPTAAGTSVISSTSGLSGTTAVGMESPTPAPSDTATTSATATATPTVATSATSTPSAIVGGAGSPSASRTPTATTAARIEQPSQTPTVTATAPSASPSATASPQPTTLDTATPEATPTATSTPTAGSTTGVDTMVTATAGMSATASATATASPITAASSTALDTSTVTTSPTATASPTAVASPTATAAESTATVPGRALPNQPVLLPPGPPPSPVAPPGPQPTYVQLPSPLSPLPPWVDAPIPVTADETRIFEGYAPNASGYASLTASQLIAGGALDNVTGYLPPIQGVITTYWGGSTPFQAFHPGIDIAGPKDVPVHAAADGIVIYAGLAVPGQPTQSYGNCAVILHNAHISTMYGHMDMGQYGLQVQAGQVVRQGQVLGYEGQTGWATGPHVHFEMRLDNVQFDPLLLINARQITG